MVKCPECGEEIGVLKNICGNITQEFTFYIVKGEAEYKYEGTLSEGGDSVFYCPRCGASLFDNEEDAERFLKGEVE